MQDFETLSTLNDKNCLIVGKPNDLMRTTMLLLVSNGCEVNLGIDYSNEKEVLSMICRTRGLSLCRFTEKMKNFFFSF